MFERGPYVNFANCGLPYYVGGVSSRDALFVSNPDRFTSFFRVDVRLNTEVVGICASDREGVLASIRTKAGRMWRRSCSALSQLLPREMRLNFPNVKMPPFHALVIGGASTGLECAELTRSVKRTREDWQKRPTD